MKTKYIYFLLIGVIVTGLSTSCKQDIPELQPQTTSTTTPTGNKGNLDFTKFVSIGNSLTAGFQAGALFTEGQQNSFPMILSKQFSIAQGTTITFNQPDINSVNGFNSSYSSLPNIIRGRLVLFAADGIQADAIPTAAGTPGVPAPYNSADIPSVYSGDKSKLNNFGVPGILLGQVLIPQTGGPSTGNPYYNALYARFASNPGTSTIIGDAIATQPTFFTFDLGNNDVLGYATTGGDHSIPLTNSANFQSYYQNAIGALMQNTSAKGVVTTIPNVTTIPFFLTIAYNAIPLDATTATQLMGASGFGGYNQVMQGIAYALTMAPATFGLDAAHAAPIIAEINTRLVTFSASTNNKILIKDETLIDMKPFFDGLLAAQQITQAQRAALEPYRKIRQTTSSDLIPLTAGAILGKTVGGNPLYVNGISIPLEDKYVLIKAEVDSINNATTAYNQIINSVAGAFATRVVVADVNAAFGDLMLQYKTAGGIYQDNVLLQPNFTPPYGVFSEDGVHPNSRGYAYLANIIIGAINANTSWGASVPKANLSDYKGTGLPLVP